MSLKKQAGSMLMTALFVAVVMLALGVALVKILSGSAHHNAVEYYGARAFLAAQSGIEQGLTQLFPLNAAVTSCASVTPAITYSTAYLSGCTIALTCNDDVAGIVDLSLPSGAVSVFRLSAAATCPVYACAEGNACRKEFWQTQRTINVEAKTLN